MLPLNYLLNEGALSSLIHRALAKYLEMQKPLKSVPALPGSARMNLEQPCWARSAFHRIMEWSGLEGP